jgi:hypothetical protein
LDVDGDDAFVFDDKDLLLLLGGELHVKEPVGELNQVQVCRRAFNSLRKYRDFAFHRGRRHASPSISLARR